MRTEMSTSEISQKRHEGGETEATTRVCNNLAPNEVQSQVYITCMMMMKHSCAKTKAPATDRPRPASVNRQHSTGKPHTNPQHTVKKSPKHHKIFNTLSQIINILMMCYRGLQLGGGVRLPDP